MRLNIKKQKDIVKVGYLGRRNVCVFERLSCNKTNLVSLFKPNAASINNFAPKLI